MLWSYWLGDPLTSTPTIAKGRVFSSYPIAGRGGLPNAPASKPKPGPKKKQKQRNNAPSQAAGGILNTPLAARDSDANSAAVATSKPQPPQASHVLACFDLKTGTIVWQRWLDSDVMSASRWTMGTCNVLLWNRYRFKQADGSLVSPRVAGDISAW
jgi:hypothetical protein